MKKRAVSGERDAKPRSPKRTNANDLTGRTFGRLKVVEESDERASNGAIIWGCVCQCGKAVQVISTNLLSRNTQSCGCWQREISRRQGKLK